MTGLRKQYFERNRHSFHVSLNRIIDKYTRLHSIDAGFEVDLDDENFSNKKFEKCLKKSRKMLKELESQSTTYLREDSLTAAQEMTGHSVQLDLTHQDADSDLSVSEDSRLSVNETGTTPESMRHRRERETEEIDMNSAGMTGLEATRLTISSVDEGQRTFSEVELQPEDQDEDLQTSLSSNGSSLWELYPDMMGRVKTAMHKQHVCEAAGDVLRRYHRLRKKPKRNYLNNTVVVSYAAAREESSEQQLKENYCSPVRRQFTRTEASPRTPLQSMLGDVRSSPGKECSSPRRSPNKPILVMSLDCPFLNPEPKEISLNQTITVTRQSPSKLSAFYSGSPRCSTIVSPSRQFKARPSPARSVPRAGRPLHAAESTAVDERSDLYSSLVRRSPSVPNISRSPQKFYRSPKHYSMYFDSGAARRSSSPSPGLSSLSRRLTVRPARVFSQASQRSSEPPPPRSRRPVIARHLSFDSSLQSLPVPLSPQQIDEEYRKVFHKFMCQHKWGGAPAPASPCSLCLCARSFEVHRGHSSSVLSALALSPHASVQRKRLREWDCGSHRESKSVRREGSMLSDRPFQNRDMLRRRLYPAEWEAPGCRLPSSSRTYGEFHRFPTGQPKVHPKTTMALHWPPPAADVSALGAESDDDQE